MRNNRRIPKKLSSVVTFSMSVGAIILLLFIVVIFNLMGLSQCSQLMKTINTKEAQLTMWKAELERNVAQWESAKASVNLERALIKRGIAMYYPNPHQIVRMDANGKPLPSQTSVALLQRRANAFRTAQYNASHGGVTTKRSVR